jgi:CO dehydrogenase/acetyl-CoA synthase beta subunit
MNPHEEDEDVEDVEEDEDVEDDEEEGFDLGGLLAHALITPEGETLCGTMVKIANTLETQNKILIKLLTLLKK